MGLTELIIIVSFFVVETPAEGRFSDLALPKMPIAVLWIQSMPMATSVSVNTCS